MEMITINPTRDVKMVSKKPPIAPKPQKVKSELPVKAAVKGNQTQWKTDEDNVQQIHKLIALNDKMTIEIGDLRKQLQHERGAVRELR